MIKILIFLFIPVFAFSQSTGTITSSVLSSPTTYQILWNRVVKHIITDEGKLVALNMLLNDLDYYKSLTGVSIDEKTGQLLSNAEAYRKRVVRNKRLGRTYIDYINCPKFRIGK